MDLHEQHQLDMAGQMAKVKARTRPWRAIIALVLAAAAGIVASVAGRNFEYWTGHGHVGSKLVAAVAAELTGARCGRQPPFQARRYPVPA